MSKTLTDADLEQLRDLIDAIDYRLTTTHWQMLAEAAHGEVLTPENSFQLDLDPVFHKIKQIRSILGLPLRNRGDRSQLPPD